MLCIICIFFFENKTNFSNVDSEEIEALTACESIGWFNNDGNCVKNSKGEYFCKTDDWLSFTDCIMNK